MTLSFPRLLRDRLFQLLVLNALLHESPLYMWSLCSACLPPTKIPQPRSPVFGFDFLWKSTASPAPPISVILSPKGCSARALGLIPRSFCCLFFSFDLVRSGKAPLHGCFGDLYDITPSSNHARIIPFYPFLVFPLKKSNSPFIPFLASSPRLTAAS